MTKVVIVMGVVDDGRDYAQAYKDKYTHCIIILILVVVLPRRSLALDCRR